MRILIMIIALFYLANPVLSLDSRKILILPAFDNCSNYSDPGLGRAISSDVRNQLSNLSEIKDKYRMFTRQTVTDGIYLEGVVTAVEKHERLLNAVVDYQHSDIKISVQIFCVRETFIIVL